VTGAPRADAPGPSDDDALEERLARPTAAAVAALRRCPGDVVVLGAGGKMGPSLARMLRRAADAADGARTARRVFAVSRWSAPDGAEGALEDAGVETRRCDLLDRAAVAALPDAPNVVFMAGQKFGTTDAAHRTWAMNTIVPAVCADRYAGARTVAFSTGNVYALSPAGVAGTRPRMSAETDAPAPVGEYAASCLGRERVFEHYAATRGTPLAIVRLNYAVDLRYGVLVDIARRVWAGEPVDVTMGYVNVIWQGDANALAIAALAHAAPEPPFVVNVTGPLRLSVREVAHDLGALLGRTAVIAGAESPDALLADTARMRGTLGEAEVDYPTLAGWVAAWVRRGGRSLGKPTRFEVRDGRF
jgi:nucleoside-diphosphate-sugar epimerase